MEPSKKQLKGIIASGDDSRLNSLILKTDGRFELMDITGKVPAQVKFPDYVVGRFETFGRNNGYVGIEAAKDDDFINSTFNDMMKLWDIHKVSGRTNMHAY